MNCSQVFITLLALHQSHTKEKSLGFPLCLIHVSEGFANVLRRKQSNIPSNRIINLPRPSEQGEECCVLVRAEALAVLLQ